MPPTIIVSGLIKPVGLRIRASDQQVVAQGGQFFVEVGEVKDAHVQAHYLGVYPYAPCDSRIVEV